MVKKDKGIKDKVLRDIRRFFKQEKDKGIKDRVLRDRRTLYESDEEDCYKPIRAVMLLAAITLNMKVMEIKIKHHQLKSI